MLLALNCARDLWGFPLFVVCCVVNIRVYNDVYIQAGKRMSHTWVTPSSSTRVQGQRSSERRTQLTGRQETGHLRGRGEPDAQFAGARRPGAVASIRTQDERSGYGHTRPLGRSDRRYEGEGIVRPEHEQPLSESQPGGLQRYSEHCSFSDVFIVCALFLPVAVKGAITYSILSHPRTKN